MLSSSNKANSTCLKQTRHHKVSEAEAVEAWKRARSIVEAALKQVETSTSTDQMDMDIDLHELHEPLETLKHSNFGAAFLRLFEYVMETFTASLMRNTVPSDARWSMCVGNLHKTFNCLRSICEQVQTLFGTDLTVMDSVAAVIEALLPTNFETDLTALMIAYLKGCQDSFDKLQMTRAVGLESFLNLVLFSAIDSTLADLMQPYRTVLDEECFGIVFNLFETSISPKIMQIMQDRLTPKAIDDLKRRVYKAIGIMRVDAMFDIIVDYPDSEPAKQDLSTAMTRFPELRNVLASRTIDAVKRRLLRPSAKTDDIIQFYISTISAMSSLDERGHLVHAITQHICDYLRNRDDTVRCIIHRIFHDEDFASDLRRPDLITVNEELTDDEWEPTPKDLPLIAFHKQSDILSSLVKIYDSKDVFVKEFQVYLSNRLLEITDFEYEEEIGHVELLKTRFGDCLHSCEVMLRDMLDSKHIHQLFRGQGDEAKDAMEVLVLSHLFWPPVKSAQFNLPENMKKILHTFEKQFEPLKRSRKLKWQHDQGIVDLTLTMGDGTSLDVSVSTLHAAIISLFDARGIFATCFFILFECHISRRYTNV